MNKLDQAILALVLESVSYKRIAADFDMTPAEVSAHADSAMKQLHLFLNRLGSYETQQRQMEERAEKNQQKYQATIHELREENAKLKAENESQQNQIRQFYTDPASRRKFILNTPIHHLAISPRLQSVLIRAGYYTLQDALDPDATPICEIPLMTSELMKELVRFLKVTGIQV